MMGLHQLPLPPEFTDSETFVDSLLRFATSSELFQRLCGGVHILDFLTREPDLYTTVLPEDWRNWFHHHDISNILDLLMREDLTQFGNSKPEDQPFVNNQKSRINNEANWRHCSNPPSSLIEYIQAVRKHSLQRTVDSFDQCALNHTSKPIILSRNVSVGMKPKKKHEVESLTKYIENLINDLNLMDAERITHIVDFGSGQNYLGRALASSPYNRNVIAIEGKPHNINGAKLMDVTAKLSKKEEFMRNKKEFRQGIAQQPTSKPADSSIEKLATQNLSTSKLEIGSRNEPSQCNGSIRYVQFLIQNGDLSQVTSLIPANSRLMVVSLHSCGNLLHHGLRSLVINPLVKVVAMVGCCYNLVTESLGPPTTKLPNMRSSNVRLDRASSACDPHGFPISERLTRYEYGENKGIRFNITARMMAVQAPQNWTSADCDSFFTRHFYRALLQRIFLDRGLLKSNGTSNSTNDHLSECAGGSEPILIGSLRKSCYESFDAYVHGALAKLDNQTERGDQISIAMSGITNADILKYESMYNYKRKELSIVWSLMAFSAGVVESIIVIDRWLYLKEQTQVKHCWVQAIFDYKQSPRNLVIVGIKK